MNKKALVLLNMGGARDKKELGVFLKNMFNDKSILNIPNKTVRSIVASLIVILRHNKAWKNYEQIGGSSPLHELTEQLVKKIQQYLPDYFIVICMRYTAPFAQTVIMEIEKQGITDIVLLPLYPQFSITTTQSSVDDFYKYANNKFNIKVCKPFYKNKLYNEAICDEIMKVQDKHNDFHLIFSAHGLPQKVIDSGDPYQKQVEEHIEILKEKLANYDSTFKSINLAYQSKIGPMKWLTPSLGKMLENFKDKKIIIYPISFIIDNSETIFELSIEYQELAHQLGIKEYKVCQCLNDSEVFVETIKDIIENN